MKSSGQWLSSQIKGYVMTNIPSWGNLSGNVVSNSPVPFVSSKPPLTTNFIWVSDEYSVELPDDLNPATVKPLYEEIY